jgi:hypothetical protein
MDKPLSEDPPSEDPVDNAKQFLNSVVDTGHLLNRSFAEVGRLQTKTATVDNAARVNLERLRDR